jgi:hypothetical protein
MAAAVPDAPPPTMSNSVLTSPESEQPNEPTKTVAITANKTAFLEKDFFMGE